MIARHPPAYALLLAASIGMSTIFSTSAYAGEVERAEHTRVSEEMRKLAQRNAWGAVEAQFQKLIALQAKGETLSVPELALGIQAAQNLGDITSARSRLSQAVKIEANTDFQNALQEIDANYGHVILDYDARYGVDRTIVAAVPPFAPDQRAAIAIANTIVLAEKDFDGLLPAGDYSVGTHKFTVAAGKDAGTVLVAPTAAEKKVFELSWAGPRATVGVSALQAGALNAAGTSADAGLQATQFGGVGARFGVGIDMGLSEHFGVLAMVGYHDMYGAARYDGELTESTATAEVKGNAMHMGYGWLAASARFGKFSAAAGPIWGVGGGAVTGVSGYCATSAGGACPEASEIGEDNARYQRLSGRIMAGGGAASVSYALFDVGPFSGAATLEGGAQTDSYRLLPWGQVGLTLAPATKSD